MLKRKGITSNYGCRQKYARRKRCVVRTTKAPLVGTIEAPIVGTMEAPAIKTTKATTIGTINISKIRSATLPLLDADKFFIICKY